MNFYDYMMTHHYGEDSPAGDLAVDMQRDNAFPKTGTYDQIRRHLWRMEACPECMETFQACWEEYKDGAD